ncbi:hypothetical protein SARC_10774 [Sphaeroforma arctica JP610]|uniref:Uncharacterized protein n=1 Tax=Sphaeroforma arctica JP610 TaxID=667725 RepID=A0A0L0FIZ0_9EUKA|nr:hypothetical protein SARC_10774 [Sphaeroforma arctica JP610]KNC76744.1 hypothetical protein SARC_10774 [Sphaeroforma arctica JP610]|eukprot:XP_014150646.1 hypothetical protein SARC_10774 [Sphaeroforma arctica JP610]
MDQNEGSRDEAAALPTTGFSQGSGVNSALEISAVNTPPHDNIKPKGSCSNSKEGFLHKESLHHARSTTGQLLQRLSGTASSRDSTSSGGGKGFIDLNEQVPYWEDSRFIVLRMIRLMLVECWTGKKQKGNLN